MCHFMPFIDGMLKAWNSILQRCILHSLDSVSHFGFLSITCLNLFFSLHFSAGHFGNCCFFVSGVVRKGLPLSILPVNSRRTVSRYYTSDLHTWPLPIVLSLKIAFKPHPCLSAGSPIFTPSCSCICSFPKG